MGDFQHDPVDYRAIERRAAELRAQAVRDCFRHMSKAFHSVMHRAAASFHILKSAD